MSRVLLIGSGPLPADDPQEMGFPHLRTRQFLLPLVGAGHEVTLATLTPRPTLPPDPSLRRVSLSIGGASRDLQRVDVAADEPGRFLALRDIRREVRPDVVVTAGPFLPMAAGARAAADEPLWIDVPGDPMCEAQARAARSGSDQPILRYREMLGWALARGDRFSTISSTQRKALVGALGLAGRLTGSAMGEELVSVAPGSVEGLASDLPGGPAPPGLDLVPGGAFVVLFCGGWNTWLDADTMLDGLLRAMENDPDLHFVSTGGALRDHDETTYGAFVRRSRESAHADRFHFLGWIATAGLPAVWERADAALFVDHPCYEAEFGARTRVLEALERGVPVAATDLCDLTAELRDTAAFRALPPNDPDAVARALQALRNPPDGNLRSADPVRARHSLAATTAPLLRWVASPQRAPGGVPVDFLEDYWQELARLQERLEEVWQSPTWRYLGRVHKLLGRVIRR